MMTFVQQTKWLLSLGLLWSGIQGVVIAAEPPAAAAVDSTQAAERTGNQPVDLFDAIDEGLVDVTFVARDAERGRLVMANKTDQPVEVLVPEAFAGVPVLRQFGGGGGGLGGGGGGFGGGGGGNQSVGGGGGGGRGGGGGGFNIPPEEIARVDVPLLCLDHGLKDPSSSKPYEIRPIEDVVDDPATIAIIKGYANGELPHASSQAAVWHLNSGVSWEQLAAKLTGTRRQFVRHPYFSRDEMQMAMSIVNRARTLTIGETVEPRNWQPPREGESGSPERVSTDSTEMHAEPIDQAKIDAVKEQAE